MSKKKNYKEETKLVHLGRDPQAYYGVANLPVSRVSTIMYPSLAAYEDKNHKFRYGRVGNPMSEAFETAMAEIEGGYHAITASSGLAAITTTLQAFLSTGDHILLSDSIYPPTRIFCDDVLKRMGIEIEYYDPKIGTKISKKIRGNTSVIYMESPGSATFDILDVPAIVEVAKKRGIKTILDNSWSGGILFKPILHGVNISVQSATKYVGGHSDVSLGVSVADTEENYKVLKRCAVNLGTCAGADELWLALRGLRTIGVRIKQNAENAMKVALWLKEQKEIDKVFYPALPDDPNHSLWKRDFIGANGLITIILKPSSKNAVEEFVDGLKLFPIGSSWGGYESLLQPQYLKTCRSAVPWKEEGACLRLQIGLENPEDLIEDLRLGLERFSSFSS